MEPLSTAVGVGAATRADVPELSALAARTFPLACPPSSTSDNVAAFIAANLSTDRFAAYLADPDRAVLVARAGDDPAILGYAMLVDGVPDDPDVQRAVTVRPSAELSKIYVAPEVHGAGVAAALMAAAVEYARRGGARSVWLGVNQQNQRAQRFYGKQGFTVAGAKTFQLGTEVEHDYVMTRPL